jgi:putative transposase
LTEWKKLPELAFLNMVSPVPLQQALRHQRAAMRALFARRARYPRFKSRNAHRSASFTRSAFPLKCGALWLAKTTEPLAYVWSWTDVDPAGLDPSMVTVCRDSDGRWFVTFAVDVAAPTPAAPTGRDVGVDLGLKDFAVLCTGERIPNPRHMDRYERRLKRYRRILARKQRGSNDRRKARIEVARAHNRRLAKSISRAGWPEFRQILAYKAARAGRTLSVADRWYASSKICSTCGHRLATLSLSSRAWQCPACGARHGRDVNAAKNILAAAGLAEAQNARGADVRPIGATLWQSAAKQETPRATVGVPRP